MKLYTIADKYIDYLRQFDYKDYEIDVNESISNNSAIYEPMIEPITLGK